MTNTFEDKVNNFVELVKTFNTKDMTRSEYIFNPWKDTDDTDREQAPNFRCENLRKYLIDKQNADYILIAESPSKGARYTGIAMTSEKVIKDYNLNYDYSSSNYQKSPKGEITASKVWKEITKSKKTFVLWNAFAFNIHTAENKWFENPMESELIANKDILKEFLAIYPKAKVIAVGNTAKAALDILNIKDTESVRHPSNDFKKEFPLQMAKYL